MAERLTFTAPPPAPTAVEVVGFTMHRNNPMHRDGIHIFLLAVNTGDVIVEKIDGEEGVALIEVLNALDLRTITLRERILRWLVNNRPGYAGTVATVPDE